MSTTITEEQTVQTFEIRWEQLTHAPASSQGGDFNFDFNVSFTQEQQKSGACEYNIRPIPGLESVSRGLQHRLDQSGNAEPLAEIAASVGTDWLTYAREAPGMSAFALRDGAVYHTYSAFARGLDALWGGYQWLDRAPKGRNEVGAGVWWRRHDEYDRE